MGFGLHPHHIHAHTAQQKCMLVTHPHACPPPRTHTHARAACLTPPAHLDERQVCGKAIQLRLEPQRHGVVAPRLEGLVAGPPELVHLPAARRGAGSCGGWRWRVAELGVLVEQPSSSGPASASATAAAFPASQLPTANSQPPTANRTFACTSSGSSPPHGAPIHPSTAASKSASVCHLLRAEPSSFWA